MPLYENVFIARQELSTAQVEALTESFATIVRDNGGTIAKTEYWGLRNLAYRIKKNRKGHYVLFNLDTPADAVKELERNMRINEDMLRYITIRVDELEEGPSMQMQSRGGRESGRRGDRHGDRHGDRWRGRGREREEEGAKKTQEAAASVDKSADAKSDSKSKEDA